VPSGWFPGGALLAGRTRGGVTAPARRSWRGLIRDATGDRQLADDWYLDLSIEIVSRLPSDEFELRASDVATWLDASPLYPSDA
jgi:hypothetical protein